MIKWRPKIFPKKKGEIRQELHCHNCDSWVQFILDTSIDGNHVLNCPNCNHEHCRVVTKGKITNLRWDQRNGPTIYASAVTITVSSTYTNLYNVYQCHGTTSTVFDWGS